MYLHVLGHVHFTRHFSVRQEAGRSAGAGGPVPVSGKAAALLTYLCLEGVAHHREHLAELFWDTADPLRNLRVELARLKRDGVVSFPDRQPMLLFQCPLDLTAWTEQAESLQGASLTSWLARLRGLPLSGLEDLGRPAFQEWLEAQRSVINDQVERTLDRVYLQLRERRQLTAAGQVEVRAKQLGFRLPAVDGGVATVTEAMPVPKPDPGAESTGAGQVEQRPGQRPPAAPGEWQAVWIPSPLAPVLDLAEGQPQLVLLSGRTGSGKHTLIRQATGTGWQAIQLQATETRALFQEALWLHLAALLPPDPRRVPVPRHPDGQLIELASVLHASGLRLIVALHHAARGQLWLPEVTRFLLDLPLPLVLILCETLPVEHSLVRERLSFVAQDRTHHLQMSPLTPGMVLRAWQQQPPEERSAPELPPGIEMADTEMVSAEASRWVQAVRLVQRTEGWPLHAQVLARLSADAELPDAVVYALLGEVAGLPPPVKQGLARLSLVHARFDLDLARRLLGEDAPQVLAMGVQQALLVPSAAQEHLLFPSLQYRSEDRTRQLQFSREALRVALAASLSGLERQQIRRQLAEHYLDSDPAFSLYYAEQANLPELAAQARERLVPAARRLPVHGPAAARPWMEPAAAPPGPASASARREQRTPNGYRVALDDGQLDVMRYGWYGPPPLLSLDVGVVPAGPWVLTVRLDRFVGSPELVPHSSSLALGLRVGAGPGVAFVSGPLADDRAEEAWDTGRTEGPLHLPLHQWLTVRGEGQGGRLQVQVRALEVALTVAGLSWGGRSILPVSPC